MRTMRATILGTLAAGLLTVPLLVAAPAQAAGARVPATGDAALQAAPGSKMLQSLVGFAPGNIIDDTVFFDSASMSEAQIQSFLDGKVPQCQSGYTCLKDKRDTSRTTAADAMCRAYAGASDERAARIIHKVAEACGINPQVLLVTLQKEQGLVTHTWPSDWRYTIAMGQGCPDTAACDTRYYGFFNQVYGAAWQLKRYANPPGTSSYFTWYAPGKTWNVLYHPNRDCGSSPVYIQNQATANLYYYTPYQPNAAALRAGYGTGDGCSSYGNRNFYNYFTDWFGSTRGGARTLVRTAGDPAVWLLSGSSRWHVADGDDYQDLSGAFGAAAIVPDAFLAGYTARGTTTAILRSDSTGEVALVQSGQRHRFASCELVARWGADCAAPVTVSDALLSKLVAGPEMTSYYRVRNAAEWGRLDTATSSTRLYNEAAARAVNGDPAAALYGALVSSSRLQALQKAPMIFAPAQLVKAAESDRVYLTSDFDGLRWVPSWDSVAEYNRTSATLAVVPAAELTARYREVGTVAPTISCDTTTYYPASGYLFALGDPARTGLGVMPSTAATCAQFAKGSVIDGPLFVKTAASAAVSAVEAGKARPVVSWSALLAFNAGASPVVVTVKPATLASLPVGALIADGEVVKASGPALRLVSETTAHPIPTLALASDLGLRLDFVAVTDAQLPLLGAGADLGHWVTCGGATFFGASGGLRPVQASAGAGFTSITLSPAACSRMPKSTGDPLAGVFVKATGTSEVYVAENGVYRHVTSMAALLRLTSGATPAILEIGPGSFAALPIGTPIT